MPALMPCIPCSHLDEDAIYYVAKGVFAGSTWAIGPSFSSDNVLNRAPFEVREFPSVTDWTDTSVFRLKGSTPHIETISEVITAADRPCPFHWSLLWRQFLDIEATSIESAVDISAMRGYRHGRGRVFDCDFSAACEAVDTVPRTVGRWVRIEPFKPVQKLRTLDGFVAPFSIDGRHNPELLFIENGRAHPF